MRRQHDFYETPAWQVRALTKRLAVRSGTVFECCSGDKSLCNALNLSSVRYMGTQLFTNDIDPRRIADTRLDATLADSWAKFPACDWVVTNPQYNQAFEILVNARQHAKDGVALLLRLSFLEPTEKRGGWLAENPPRRLLVLPRYSYTANGRSDSVTTAWMIWGDSIPQGIEIVPKSEKD